MKKVLRIVVLFAYIFLIVLLYLPEHDSVDILFYSCHEINCSQALVDLLIKYPNHQCAFYDLEDDELYNQVREGVLFEDNYEIKYSKLTSVTSKGLMHHKFCVLDDQYVFTGSWNPTERGTYKNDNYILFIDSKRIAKKYVEEYNHLTNRKQEVEPLTIYSTNKTIELYFCPQHNCQEQVLRTLQQAKESVKILAFTFTDEEITEQLLYLSRNNVSVEVIFEKTRITKYSAYHSLSSSISVLMDVNSFTMHEKMFIIDEETVILGSYNPTKGATLRNDENLLVIRDKQLARTVLLEYSRVHSLITT